MTTGLATLLGIDREFSRKAAGLRTNMLVYPGAALFILVAVQSGMAQTNNTAMARTL
ncbi:MAG: hypothetical protein DCF32_03105 [Leptolyngbya sp.]|nr:MAG: hypothetical protein DCF32_03105 [Leptolyngbya sp.]